MKSGYDQFFKNARKVADQQSGKKNPPRRTVQRALDIEEELEKSLRQRMQMAPKKNPKRQNKTPWKMIGGSVVGFTVAICGFYNYEQVENFIKSVEIQMAGEAFAEDKQIAPAKENSPADKTKEISAEKVEVAQSTIDIDHLQKLNERKKELDGREEELNRMENELQAQKEDLEKRLKELEDMRAKISSILEERVKVDEQKVDTLVQMYTNMKAPQAAKVFETMDEDLAIEILGRMKKKNAADIMNLLKPEKAQVLSEMFAGYRRRSPASK